MDDGKPCLYIRADGAAAASWRRPVQLDPGKYRFEARVKTKAWRRAKTSGEGAGLRISGGTRNGINKLAGDSPWQDSFLSQLKRMAVKSSSWQNCARSKGEVWFDKSSLQLVRQK
jgi:osmotically-inducible protein OsmY